MRVIDGVTGVIALGFLGFIGCSAGAPATGDENASSSAAQDEALRLGRLCDGPPGLSCPRGQYCSARTATRCPGQRAFGVCAPQPQACPDLFAPACGCDGHTYPNSCFAAAAGVAVEHTGACPVSGPTCGGIAGIPCPGFGKCVDDSSDNCDPANGGTDCSGICSCIDTVACKLGTHFDSDPKICTCVPDVTKQTCGGIAGIQCPGFGKCIDDPSDNCDPANGGADCGGICSCIDTVACRLGTHFDSDPKVCTCVPNAATR